MTSRLARPAALRSLATALPPHVLEQGEAREIARRLFAAKLPDFERLAPLFDNAGIRRRHIAMPSAWYEEDHGWEARNAAYLAAADALFVAAARAALDRAGLGAGEIDIIVTVSTTGIATPSIEARVAGAMGFRDDAVRVPVFGLGCAGGVGGLALAARLAAAEPGCTVLFVTLELCSISIRLDKPSKANLVAVALFGDGAAAGVLRAGEDGLANVVAAAEKTWPDSLSIMGWDVEDPGLGVVFDRAIPPFVENELGAGMEEIAGHCGIPAAKIGRFVCHPGGAKVIAALETSLHLEQGSLDHERAVLAEHGNMSAPTVLFVLERALQNGLPETAMLLALGPGFTASGALLRRN